MTTDNYRRSLYRLIDRALNARDDQAERRRCLITLCDWMGEYDVPDPRIVNGVFGDQISDCLNAILRGEQRPYTDAELHAATHEAVDRGVPVEAIRELVARFTGGPERSMRTIKSEDRGAFLDALRAL